MAERRIKRTPHLEACPNIYSDSDRSVLKKFLIRIKLCRFRQYVGSHQFAPNVETVKNFKGGTKSCFILLSKCQIPLLWRIS